MESNRKTKEHQTMLNLDLVIIIIINMENSEESRYVLKFIDLRPEAMIRPS